MTDTLLNSVAAATTHRDRDELDRSVCRLLRQFLPADAIALWRLVADGPIKRVARRIYLGNQGNEAGPDDERELVELPSLAAFPVWQECVIHGEVVQCDKTEGRPITVFPIRGEREVVGILVVETGAPLATREVDLVLGILGIVRNHLALLDYGELDTLTGLLNRKTFESHFEKLRQRMVAPSEPGWLALMDIDHFKSINDGYGHLFGDEVLLLVSQLMKRSFRGADPLFRFGGEEFIVVLERANQSGAQIVLERLRKAIEEYPFPQVGRVTVSVGYTQINPQDVPALCVERADAALYYAKAHGRNQVCNFEALNAAGQLPGKFKGGDDVVLF